MAKRLFAGITLALCLLAQGIAMAAQEARQPTWAELSFEQKQVLAPVSGEWDKMPAIQRKRLLGVVKRYPGMKADQQQRIQTRLKDWSKLTPEERALARKQYKKLKELPPEKRKEVRKKWQEYQQLPEERKVQLKKAAPAKAAPLSTPEALKTAQEPATSRALITPEQRPGADAARPAAN
ncbi:MAG: DUF3106 domain-containing protein [Sulfuricella sp.]